MPLLIHRHSPSELKPQENKIEICSVCQNKIEMIAFRMSGVCSENCSKKRRGDAGFVRALTP